MADVRSVSNSEVAAYQELVSSLAWRYNGHCGAEYDDLFQEGMLVVLLALRKGAFPSRDVIAKRMSRWVSRCRTEGMGGYSENLTEEENALFSE